MFLTDCSTRFSSNCLLVLQKALLKDPTLVGVTARMRVMSPAETFEVSQASLAFQSDTQYMKDTWARGLGCVDCKLHLCELAGACWCGCPLCTACVCPEHCVWACMCVEHCVCVCVCFERPRFWLSPAPAQAFEFVSGSVLGTAMYDTLGSLAVLPGASPRPWACMCGACGHVL